MSVSTRSRTSHTPRGGPPDDALARDAAALEARRALRLLEAVAEDSAITQRGLASKLGVALGLANLYLKRLVRRPSRASTCGRIGCIFSPEGISEKRASHASSWSIALALQKPAHLHFALTPMIRSGAQRFAIYGTGEAAELAYLSLREHGLEPAAIFDGAGTPEDGTGTREFLGMRVHDISAHGDVQFDLLIVATLDNPQSEIDALVKRGLARDQLVTVRNTDSGG
jgi:hypothetical protein